MTWAAVCKLGASLPGVEVTTSYGTPSLKVSGKFMLRLREDGQSLAVRCGFDERDFRLQLDPTTFFVTDHYKGYPAVLVHLSRVTPAVMRELLDQAWHANAPRSLLKQGISGGPSPKGRDPATIPPHTHGGGRSARRPRPT
jgi:hypothetical protein